MNKSIFVRLPVGVVFFLMLIYAFLMVVNFIYNCNLGVKYEYFDFYEVEGKNHISDFRCYSESHVRVGIEEDKIKVYHYLKSNSNDLLSLLLDYVLHQPSRLEIVTKRSGHFFSENVVSDIVSGPSYGNQGYHRRIFKDSIITTAFLIAKLSEHKTRWMLQEVIIETSKGITSFDFCSSIKMFEFFSADTMNQSVNQMLSESANWRVTYFCGQCHYFEYYSLPHFFYPEIEVVTRREDYIYVKGLTYLP